MYFSLSDPLLYIYFLYFIFSVFFAFFIPGDVLLKKIKLKLFDRVVLSTLLGLSFFVLQGYILGYLNLRFLSYLYLLCFTFAWIKNKYYLDFLKRDKIIFSKKVFYITLIIIFGTVLQISTMWMNGIKIQEGIFFCCGNNLDSLFHIALTQKIIERVPPLQPGMFPVVISNYHFLSNLVVADLVRIFKLPLIPTLYQYMTIFMSLFLGLSAICFARINKLSTTFTLWLLFFLYFGGDFIYLTLILLGKQPSFQMGALEHGALFLANPPRAYAITMFFGFLSLFSIWIKNKNFYTGFLYSIMVSVLIGLKVYVGLFALFGLGILGLFYVLSKKIKYLIPILISFLLSFIFYFPINKNSGGIYFTGFWLFENFVVQPSFGLDRMELAREVYRSHGNILRIIQYEIMYIVLYVFTIFGTKIIALFQTKKSLRLFPKEINILLISGLVVSAILGFFFQQKSGGANSFNFIVSIFIIGSIYSALAASYWIDKVPKKLAVIASIVLIILTIPRVSNQFIFNIQQAVKLSWFYIPNEELEIYSFIKNNTNSDALILVDPLFSLSDDHSPYISYFSGRNMFLSGRGILTSHNVPTHEREEIRKTIFFSGNKKEIAKLLQRNKITHMIIKNNLNEMENRMEYYIKTLFKNENGKVISISQEKLSRYLKNKLYKNNE